MCILCGNLTNKKASIPRKERKNPRFVFYTTVKEYIGAYPCKVVMGRFTSKSSVSNKNGEYMDMDKYIIGMIYRELFLIFKEGK